MYYNNFTVDIIRDIDEAYKKAKFSSDWTRTSNLSVNSRTR